MAFDSDKIMFEIYRETGYNGRYRVVYFTELNDHNKESSINRALAGEHLYDGFLKAWGKDDAKAVVEQLLERLNHGETLTESDIARSLNGYLAD